MILVASDATQKTKLITRSETMKDDRERKNEKTTEQKKQDRERKAVQLDLLENGIRNAEIYEYSHFGYCSDDFGCDW